ncbi:hypothetical protein [Dethiobacter alkaliphilus]|uniref:Spo0E like sporulation regulatory protein n=1 Tax=Dethiobacter alkaliphilus AHT 1 TaxID=555088 RepID=C0GJY3_DETAL|nr:hypothetical protein [Dethiobacter alkaliphilus]EEG76352.1 hypothetical protein DealDRAFT_2792 [Dethiobacter alkaliphilus AHT 1]
MLANELTEYSAQSPVCLKSVPDILELERAKLHFIVTEYGVDSPQALRQSRVVDNLILMQMKKRYKYVR